MDTQQRADRLRVLREARELVQAGNYVGLDTETTGLDDMAQVVSWAIVGPGGEIAGQGLVKPNVRISEDALATHHIREADLADAPAFAEAWAAMEPLIAGKTILVYGCDFDLRLLKQSAETCGVVLAGLDEWQCYCVSEAYAAFRGLPDKNPSRRYRRHKLVEACASLGIVLESAHDAAANAIATARLLQALAQIADNDGPAGAQREQAR